MPSCGAEARGHGLELRWAVENSDRAVVLDVEPAGPVTHLIARALAPG